MLSYHLDYVHTLIDRPESRCNCYYSPVIGYARFDDVGPLSSNTMTFALGIRIDKKNDVDSGTELDY
jgi:hypothetical protein